MKEDDSGNNNIGASLGQAVELFALLHGKGREKVHVVLEVVFLQLVVVHHRERVIHTLLVKLRQRPPGSAQADQGQLRMLPDPGVKVDRIPDERLERLDPFRPDDSARSVLAGSRHGAEREGNAVHPFAVQEEGDLGASAADIHDEPVPDVERADHALKPEAGFFFAGEDVDDDA